MDEFNPGGGTLGAIGAAITAFIGGFFWLRKTLASTAADVAGDRAEVNMIQVLQEENARLRERLTAVEQERNEQFKQIADLSAQLQIIQDKVQTLTTTNQKLSEEVQRLRAAVERTS
ncbi:hol-like chemotaxis [Klebsiella phage LASTA]|uniref:Holin n=2 Tax=Lastavirus lasta TaxID=2845090 RepID=A0A6H0X3M1_9CAUD|nr:hol-like chemotaxis [Klebsiella phage LASTA]QIW86702.1 holin [Klebsiella phage LASTA]QIW86778.1 holin [Klebsiella phage SJM3]